MKGNDPEALSFPGSFVFDLMVGALLLPQGVHLRDQRDLRDLRPLLDTWMMLVPAGRSTGTLA